LRHRSQLAQWRPSLHAKHLQTFNMPAHHQEINLKGFLNMQTKVPTWARPPLDPLLSSPGRLPLHRHITFAAQQTTQPTNNSE
jgi:hypothetical protein